MSSTAARSTTGRPLPAERAEVRFPGLPLATCRECATHLRQLGIAAEVHLRTGQPFDSRLDQVECIAFSLPTATGRLAQILEYYAERYRETPVSEGEAPSLALRGAHVAWREPGDWQRALASGEV